MNPTISLNRRQLLTFAGAGALALLAPGTSALAAPSNGVPIVWHNEKWRSRPGSPILDWCPILDSCLYQDYNKCMDARSWYLPDESILKDRFESSDGRDILNRDISEPIQRAVDKHSLLRTLLAPGPIGSNRLLVRARGVYRWALSSGSPASSIETAVAHHEAMNGIVQGRRAMIGRVQVGSAESMILAEDFEFFRFLDQTEGCRTRHSMIVTDTRFIPRHMEELLSGLGSRISGREAHLILSASRAVEMKGWGGEGVYVRSTARRVVIHVSDACGDEEIWAVGDPSQNGIREARGRGTFTYDYPKKLKLGWLTFADAAWGYREDMPVASLIFQKTPFNG